MCKKMLKKVFGAFLAGCLFCGGLSGSVLAEKTYKDVEKWGFETNWTKSYGNNNQVSYVEDSNYVLQGNRALKLTCSATQDAVIVYNEFTELAEGSGKTQYVTGKIRAELQEGSTARVAMHSDKVNGNTILTSRVINASCDWTEIYLPQLSKQNKIMYISITLSGEGTVYADDFKLVEDDNMTINPNFEPNLTPNATNHVLGWNYKAARGNWGKSWHYDATYGALKFTDDTSLGYEYLYMSAPYANKLQIGEMYKISVCYKGAKGAPSLYVSYTNSYLDGECAKIQFLPVGGPDADGFTRYVGYFTMPEGKQHYGFGILGEGSEAYYDDFYIEKDKTSAPVASDADGNGTISAGETVTAKMHFAEKAEKNVQLIIAVYSKIGDATRLDAVNIENFTVNGAQDISTSVTVPEEDGKTYFAKAFCWDKDSMLTPLP